MFTAQTSFHRPLALAFAFTLGFSQLSIAQEAPTEATAVPSEVIPTTPTTPAVESSSADRLPTTIREEVAAKDAKAPSTNVTINLINRMVEKGLLTKEDSADLIKQAEADAAIANEQAAAIQSAVQQIASVQSAPLDSYIPPTPLDMGIQPQAELPAAYPGPDDTMRVSYIPESVKDEMREQIKADVLAQARDENWSSPRMFPEWLTRFRLLGDLRIRYQSDMFSSGNDNTGAFPNFNAINTGAPFDVSGTVFSPQLNVDQERNRIRLRLRFGAELTLRDNFTSGFRIATGNDNSPVSTNQTLGGASGQGGNFSKYNISLDRAFLRYDFTEVENLNIAFLAGRFENPFFSTPILWDDDVGFDGFALKAKYKLADGRVVPFLSGGAFPIFNTDFNYSSNQSAKFESRDKWLYAAQLGVDWKVIDHLTAKFAVAYNQFDNVEGQLSDPFTPLTSSDQGNTDASRPAFAQKGNTYFAIRNIVPNASNNFGTTNQFQYFGLASKFTQVVLTGKIDYSAYEPFHIIFSGEWVKNTAFDAQNIESKAVNNRGPSPTGVGKFAGGDTAWIVNLRLGSPTLENRWDWAVDLGYRYVESDAVVDGFTESDFGGGGTNVKGYSLGGLLALSPDVSLGLRWMSATEIAGPPLKTDVLQIDLNSKF